MDCAGDEEGCWRQGVPAASGPPPPERLPSRPRLHGNTHLLSVSTVGSLLWGCSSG